MDYKQILYGNYVDSHNRNLYGKISLGKIERAFPALRYYYEKHLPHNKDATILDIGCGDGNFVYWLHQSGYMDACGIDVSQQQIGEGREMGIRNLTCIDLRSHLREGLSSYDVIIARDVVEHFTKNEVFEIFDLVSKSLKPNGKFIIQVPNGQGLFYTSIFFGDYTHEMAYTPSSISQIALNTGFTAAACYPVGPAPIGILSRIRHTLWRYKVLQTRFWKLVETGNSSGIFTQNLIAVIKK